MMKITIMALAVMGAAYAQQSNFAAIVGEAIGKINLGGCLAFQDNQNDTTTTCFQSCNVTSEKIKSAFNES